MPNQCSICEQLQQTSVPVIWCPECEEAFCTSCSRHHRVAKLSKDHSTIPYDNYSKLPPFILNMSLLCSDHDEKYQYFCRDHDKPICMKCIATTHKKCIEIPVLNYVIKNIKSSVAYQNIKSELTATENALIEVTENCQEKSNDLEENGKQLIAITKQRNYFATLRK